MGAASEDGLSTFHQQALNSYAHMKERAALRLNQRPFLTFLPFHEYDEIGLHLFGNSQCRLSFRGTV
jgi:hypothetical protein